MQPDQETQRVKSTSRFCLVAAAAVLPFISIGCEGEARESDSSKRGDNTPPATETLVAIRAIKDFSKICFSARRDV